MLQKPKKYKILNLLVVSIFSVLLDISGNAPLFQNHQVKAQGGIQVRTDQYLKVEKITGNVKYKNLYNYANRPARAGDRLQSVSDEISTGENGTAVLSIDTSVGSIYVFENTTIKIQSFRVAGDNGRIINLVLPRGKARLQIRKFTNRGSQLNIQTSAGISGVRGTKYIVTAYSNGNMAVTTLEGKVASSAQNRTELVGAGLQSITILGEPPSLSVPIIDNTSLRYSINRQISGAGRSILLVGYTSLFNTVKVNGIEQSLDRNGKFSIQLRVIPSSLKVNVKVETPQGKVQAYEIPIL